MTRIILHGIVQSLLLSGWMAAAWAQPGTPALAGSVGEQHTQDTWQPLVGARVYWSGTAEGTLTDSSGTFALPRPAGADRLVISFFGYATDTLDIAAAQTTLTATLAPASLETVEITRRRQATTVSFIDPLKTELISEKELLKAACCNLSESFETSPSVDVAFTDAVTGTRQIQLLGLAGPYTQITLENMPGVRGLSAMYGLTYIPGTWVEGMQLNKGAGSVVNGFESIAGQINVELRKPESADRLYLNAYINQMGRLEANTNFAHRLGESGWSTALLLHTKHNDRRHDHNDDGFLDNPLGSNFIGVHRWKYIGPRGLRFQTGVQATHIDNLSGQSGFDPVTDALGTRRWGMYMRTQRLESWTKLGKVFEARPWQSLGLQVSALYHRQDSYFGQTRYDARQQTLYANFVYQSIIGNTNHSYRTGASLLWDDYDEALGAQAYDRREIVPGAFAEYTFKHLDKFSAVAGLRVDRHNSYGVFVTPRLHLRCALDEHTVLRASAGRGQRTASILAENNGLLASARQIVVEGDDSSKPYGLDPEVAWNLGVNLTRHFRLDYREGTFSLDLYRTAFVNQIVVDLDSDPQQVRFYNLDGRSYANSLQAQVDYELLKRLDLRVAYRWYDVRTTYGGTLLQKPLVSAHRAFANLAYATRDHWVFDLTVNWQGSKRIPFTGSNPEPYRLPERSPDFVVVNAQVSKQWGERFETYLGGENLLGFRQEAPILASDQPFGPYFDSALVWGPIFGRNIYAGLRFRVK
ncbi:MAG: TonB-dependent receptor plug domain-containing protein [Bacteroidia bacterium]